jgi:hypothetical protein
MSQQSNMTFDPQALLANLTEKERVYGHHSAEGRAIRTLSRALHGWSTENLSAGDVVAMCDQAVEDWLKARLNISAWSAARVPQLLTAAVAANLLTPAESTRVYTMHDLRFSAAAGAISADDVSGGLLSAIEIVERHWS